MILHKIFYYTERIKHHNKKKYVKYFKCIIYLFYLSFSQLFISTSQGK